MSMARRVGLAEGVKISDNKGGVLLEVWVFLSLSLPLSLSLSRARARSLFLLSWMCVCVCVWVWVCGCGRVVLWLQGPPFRPVVPSNTCPL